MAAKQHEVPDKNNMYRILVAGDPGAGKQSLINKFVELGAGGQSKKTEFGDSVIASVEVGGRKIQVQMQFPAKGSDPKNPPSNYFRGMNGFLVVVDLSSDLQALAGVKNWMEQIKWLGPTKPNVILVGNKTDLPRKISKELLERTAKESDNCQFIETSAQDGTNVCNAFNGLLLKAMGQQEEATKVIKGIVDVKPDVKPDTTSGGKSGGGICYLGF